MAQSSVTVEVQADVATVTLRGPASLSLVTEALRRLHAQPDYASSLNRLWDLRAVDVTPVDHHLIQEIRLLVESEDDAGDRFTALLTTPGVRFGIARMWTVRGTMSEAGRREIFTDEPEAHAWVRSARS